MSIQRHKISLSVDYVPTWDIYDSLRELFQNCVDHGDWHWLYKNSILTLTSKNTSLDKKSLLLGISSKRDDKTKIGVHGEGYKLAMLVLCRLGFRPYILTGTDSYEPKLIKSRTYKTQQLIFDIYQDQPKVDDIVFVVPDITNEIFDELMNRNLHVRSASVGWQTSICHILPEEYAGKVFVKGLWVCDITGMRHGYDFYPDKIELDRDRRIIRDFDLQWKTAQAWKETDEFDYILSLIKEDAPDVKYLDSFVYQAKDGLADKAAEAFLDEHGPEAVPVVDNYDLGKAKDEGHDKVIIVPKVTVQLLQQSKIWTRPAPKVIKKTPREELLDFRIDFADKMSELMLLRLDAIIEHAKDWSN
jgi:hypothetical protein